MARILYVINDAPFFLRHRGMLARAALARGHHVHVATPPDPAVAQISEGGFVHHPLPFAPTGRDPLAEASLVARMAALFRRVRPDLVHLVTIKPVLYGGIAARIAGVPAVVFAVSGLGYVFIARGRRAWLQRQAVLTAYRASFRHPRSRVIFQNEHDRAVFERTALRPGQAVIIPGNGIDTDEFRVSEPPSGPPVVVLPARMLRDKGVAEFVEAARLLRARGTTALFALVGPADRRNPAAVPEAELRAWAEEGAVEWWGLRENMAEVYRQCAVVCLPSYREGMPRTLVEAAACGRPMVATDVPGCRDIVLPGISGLLVPPRDARALADALAQLVDDAELRERMGRAARRVFDETYAPGLVIERALDLYDELLDARSGDAAAGL